MLVSSKPNSGEEPQLLIEDPSVSALHAILRVTAESKIQVLDQLSEHGTGVTKAGQAEQDLSGTMVELDHGDKIRFGQRSFVLCVIP